MPSEFRVERKSNQSWERLGDFTATTRLLPISALALGIGVLASFVALALLRLIGFFTNLFYYGCVLVGLIAGILSALLTMSVYAAEDAFQRLPIHWMPMIGGLVIGLGGLVFPQALGVGYDTICGLLQGSVTTRVIQAYPDEPLRVVVYRMAEKNLTRLPVVERETGKFLGLVALEDLLKARGHNLEEERTRERILKLRFLRLAGIALIYGYNSLLGSRCRYCYESK